MVYDKANELAKLLKESNEFREYKTAREKAFENDTTASLIKEYHKLQLAAQAAMVSGKKDDETMQRLQKIGELLQLNQDASAFLFAEYRLNRVVSDIYKIIAVIINKSIFVNYKFRKCCQIIKCCDKHGSSCPLAVFIIIKIIAPAVASLISIISKCSVYKIKIHYSEISCIYLHLRRSCTPYICYRNIKSIDFFKKRNKSIGVYSLFVIEPE